MDGREVASGAWGPGAGGDSGVFCKHPGRHGGIKTRMRGQQPGSGSWSRVVPSHPGARPSTTIGLDRSPLQDLSHGHPTQLPALLGTCLSTPHFPGWEHTLTFWGSQVNPSSLVSSFGVLRCHFAHDASKLKHPHRKTWGVGGGRRHGGSWEGSAPLGALPALWAMPRHGTMAGRDLGGAAAAVEAFAPLSKQQLGQRSRRGWAGSGRDRACRNFGVRDKDRMEKALRALSSWTLY